jgi:hypothetical protein
MNDPLSTIDDILIDRLVDGELSIDERRELLASLEAQPGGWRRCALAFLEAQTWRHEMRQFVAPAVARARRETNPPKQKSRSYAGIWLGLAASVLAAFGLGQHFAQDQPPPLNAIETTPQIASSEPSAAPAGDAVTLVVKDQHGAPHRFRVALVEGRRLGAQFADTPSWSESPELTRQLNENGLGLTARRRYAPLYFEQQNQLVPMVVPVDDAVVTPVSRPLL